MATLDHFAQGRYHFTYADGKTLVCDKTDNQYTDVANGRTMTSDELYGDSLRHVEQVA